MSYIYKGCEAKEYNQCYGSDEDVHVIFKYRDFKGYMKPDEIQKVCLCKTHLDWLNALHQNKPLEMRGEVAKYALHDDLFQQFANKAAMYTLLKAEMKQGSLYEDNFYLINGRDVDKFRELLIPYDTTSSIGYIHEQGFFQICPRLVEEIVDGVGGYKFTESIIEVNSITCMHSLKALTEILTTFLKPVPDREWSFCAGSPTRVFQKHFEGTPSIDTEYTFENMPACVTSHFSKRLEEEENFSEFEECCKFIKSEVYVLDWDDIRKDSALTEEELYKQFRLLTDALLRVDEKTINEMGEIKQDVLWVTYVSANHALFRTHAPVKRLRTNVRLIELFIKYGLEHDLLKLAIAGERVRWVFNKQRDYHNILNENQIVVEFLVPKYISPETIIYKSADGVTLTPLQFWEYYSNTLTDFVDGYMNDKLVHFDKNESIKEYLEQCLEVVL